MEQVSHIESVVKAVSWRFFGSLATAGLVYGVTGSHSAALSVGGIEALGKVVLFYAHERLWFRIVSFRRSVFRGV